MDTSFQSSDLKVAQSRPSSIVFGSSKRFPYMQEGIYTFTTNFDQRISLKLILLVLLNIISLLGNKNWDNSSKYILEKSTNSNPNL